MDYNILYYIYLVYIYPYVLMYSRNDAWLMAMAYLTACLRVQWFRTHVKAMYNGDIPYIIGLHMYIYINQHIFEIFPQFSTHIYAYFFSIYDPCKPWLFPLTILPAAPWEPFWGPSQLAAHCQMQGPSAGSGCPARWKEVKQQPIENTT